MKAFHKISKTLMISLLVMSETVSAFASTVNQKDTLTLEQAVNRAITSCDVKEVYGSYLEAYEEITKYNKDEFSKAYRTSKLAEMTYKFNMKHINEKVAYDTTDTYLNVLSIYKQMELLKNKIDIADKQLKQVSIKKDRGMASELEYKTAQDTLEGLNKEMFAQEKELENEVLEFKNLTNMDITKYQLDTEFELVAVNIKGAPVAYFDKKLEDYYELSKEKIRINKLGSMEMIGSEVGPYLLQEADATKDKYDFEQLQEQMSTKLLSYYNNLATLKTSVENCDIKLNTLQEKLKAQKIKYDNGYISKLEYEQAIVEQQSLELEKFNNIKTYLTTKMIVEEPNILAMR